MATLHVERAFREQLPVRLVVAIATEPDRVDAGEDVSDMPKTFDVKEGWAGRVTSFDGDAFTIDFRKEPR